MLLCARRVATPIVLGPWASNVLHLYPGQCEPALIGALIGDLLPFIKKMFAFIEKFLFIEEMEEKTKNERKWKPTADQNLTSTASFVKKLTSSVNFVLEKLTSSVCSVHDDDTLLNAQMAQVRELQ